MKISTVPNTYFDEQSCSDVKLYNDAHVTQVCLDSLTLPPVYASARERFVCNVILVSVHLPAGQEAMPGSLC
jgi:hypothetical protein